MFNIAFNTFRELARNKILYLILFFAVLLIIFSLALASLSLGQTEKIVLDFWLSMIEIFGLVSVVFIGSQLLFKEIEWKTIYLILSKPIKRSDFIIGKFFGFIMILACIMFFQSLFFLLILLYSKLSIEPLVIYSLFFIFLKLAILFAIILFFSTFTSSIISIIITILVYFIAHSVNIIIDTASRQGNTIMLQISKVLGLLFPNFEALNTKTFILSSVKIGSDFVLINTIYWILYLIIMLIFTVLIFNRKTFES